MYHTIVMVSVVGLTLKGQATSHHFEGTLGSAQRETGGPVPVCHRPARPFEGLSSLPSLLREALRGP